MDNLGLLFFTCMDLLEQEYEIWGFSISLWNILAFGCVTSTVAWAIWEIIDRS